MKWTKSTLKKISARSLALSIFGVVREVCCQPICGRAICGRAWVNAATAVISRPTRSRPRPARTPSRRSSQPSSCSVWTIVTPFVPDHQDTLLTSCRLQCVSSLAHKSSTTACHTSCMRNCTGSTSQNVSTTNWESQCIAVCRTRLQSTWSSRLPYTSLRHSQPTSSTASHSTSHDRTKLPPQHFRSSGLLCRWSDGLELATGQSPRPGAHQQQLQTIAENKPISSLPLSTHSAVEMLHDYALYKSIIKPPLSTARAA